MNKFLEFVYCLKYCIVHILFNGMSTPYGYFNARNPIYLPMLCCNHNFVFDISLHLIFFEWIIVYVYITFLWVI